MNINLRLENGSCLVWHRESQKKKKNLWPMLKDTKKTESV